MQNFSESWEPWKTYVTLFSLSNYKFVSTNQLLHQFQTWQSRASHLESHPEPTNQVDPELNLEDDIDFAIETGGKQGEMTEEAPENIDENNIEPANNLVTSHGLQLLPSDFHLLRKKIILANSV